MSADRPKVVSVNTSDLGGGAERVASTLHGVLHERGWDAWLLVGDKKTADPRVLSFHASPYFDYRPYSPRWYQAGLSVLRRWDRLRGLQSKRFPYSRQLLRITGSLPDIVHLHNLHGGYFDLRALPEVSARVPTFVTLMDCWWFSGHCAYSLDCERWKTGCGSCPLLHLPPEPKRTDATHRNWINKRRIYARSRLYAAVPSSWLLRRAEASIFSSAVVEAREIPLGIDLTVFRPADGHVARHGLGIDPDAFVVLFAATAPSSNPYKDFGAVEKAMHILASKQGGRVKLLVAGEAGPERRIGRVLIEFMGFVESPGAMSELYRAADVYVHGTRSETFGLVLAEASASGIPSVATRAGATPEVIEHGKEGFLVDDAKDMAMALHVLEKDEALRRRLGRAALARARRQYDQDLMVRRYETWYEEILARQARPRAGTVSP